MVDAMETRIPRTLDNPARCLGVPIDAVIVAAGVYISFSVFEMGMWGLLASPICANIFSKYRSRTIVRRFMRFIYWYLPFELNFIRGIQGHQRKLTMRPIRVKSEVLNDK